MGSYLYIELQQPSGMPFGDSQPPVTVGIAKDSATFRGKHAPPQNGTLHNLGHLDYDGLHIQTDFDPVKCANQTQEKSNSFLRSISGSPALLAIFRHVLLREIADIKVPRSHKNYHKNI